MYFSLAERNWRTQPFYWAGQATFRHDIGYKITASPLDQMLPDSRAVAEWAIAAFGDLLHTVQDKTGIDIFNWSVYDQLFTKNDVAPPKDWFRFVPDLQIGGLEIGFVGNVEAGYVPFVNPATEGSLANRNSNNDNNDSGDSDMISLPEPALPLPELGAHIERIGAAPLDPRSCLLAISIALTTLPYSHAANEKTTAGGFGPGQNYVRTMPAHNAYIRIDSLADYAGTQQEVTFLAIGYALRQIMLYAGTNMYYGELRGLWTMKNSAGTAYLPPFLRITIARLSPGLGDILKDTGGAEVPPIFEELANQPFESEGDGTTATEASA